MFSVLNQHDYFSLLRYYLALVILFIIFACLPWLTVFNNSVQINNILAQAQLVFFFLTIKETAQTAHFIFLRQKYRFLLVFLMASIILLIVSLFVVSGFDRFLFYFTGILFFLSLISFFYNNSKTIWYALSFKLLSVILACLWFLWMFIISGWYFNDSIYGNPPLYNNIRHFNYDLMAAIGVAFVMVVSGKIRFNFFFFIIFFLGFFSIWSGGRGQLASMLVLFTLVFISRLSTISTAAILATVFAFFAVILSGQSSILFSQVERTVGSDGINSMSSNRLAMWRGALEEAIAGGWIGHGADSFRHFDETVYVQPHNSVIQFMFEYGYLGLLLFVLFFYLTGFRLLKLIIDSGSGELPKVISSLILCMYAYSLVDGIFYHAMPFSFMILIASIFYLTCKDCNLIQSKI